MQTLETIEMKMNREDEDDRDGYELGYESGVRLL